MSLVFASRVKDSNQPLNFNFWTVLLLEIVQNVISVLFNCSVTDIAILHCWITVSHLLTAMEKSSNKTTAISLESIETKIWILMANKELMTVTFFTNNEKTIVNIDLHPFVFFSQLEGNCTVVLHYWPIACCNSISIHCPLPLEKTNCWYIHNLW